MRTIKEFREKNYEILTQLKMPGMLETYIGQAVRRRQEVVQIRRQEVAQTPFQGV